MKSAPTPDPADRPPAPVDDAVTGVPLFHTWRGVYLFVLGCLAAWVLGLLALSRMFS
jgi:hypothetical protein